MPQVWNAERHERLLKTLVKNFSLNTAGLAQAYNTDWGTTDTLTKSAIDQHFNKLVKTAGSKGVKKLGAVPKTPSKQKSTPISKPAASATPKTPSSSGKRKKFSVSDEEDADDDAGDSDCNSTDGLAIDLPRRKPLSRRSKAARKTYLDESDADAEGEMEDDDDNPTPKATPGGHVTVHDDDATVGSVWEGGRVTPKAGFAFGDGDTDIFSHRFSLDGASEAQPAVEGAANGNAKGSAVSRRSGIAQNLRHFLANGHKSDESDESDWVAW